MMDGGRPSRAVMRGRDILVSALGILVLSPVIAAVALAIRLSMGSPVLFRQERTGYLGQPFELVKFRTMRNLPPTPGAGQADTGLPGAARLESDLARTSRVGRFLRRTSLDEIPQLWNILRGEMSLVGPRPLLVSYLPHYTPEEVRRHLVRPGLTGWAQIQGRRNVPMHERFLLDVWYVDHWSLGLDLQILLATARRIATADGAAPSKAPDPFFERLRGTPVPAACDPEALSSPAGSEGVTGGEGIASAGGMDA